MMIPLLSSKTIPRQLARGVVALIALSTAPLVAAIDPLLSLINFAVALLSFRGCPLCWLVGLVQLVGAKLTDQPTEGLCVDGSCAIRSADQGVAAKRFAAPELLKRDDQP
jgi:hypothetical protein